MKRDMVAQFLLRTRATACCLALAWAQTAMAESNALEVRCMLLIQDIGRSNWLKTEVLFSQSETALRRMYTDLRDSFSEHRELAFVQGLQRHNKSVSDQFTQLHQGTGLYLVQKLRITKVFASSSAAHPLPYFEIAFDPKQAAELPHTRTGALLIETLQAYPKAAIAYEPLHSFYGGHRAAMVEHKLLERPTIFLSLQDLLSIEYEPMPLRHEIIHLHGLEVAPGIDNVRDTSLIPNFHNVEHFFSEDMRSARLVGLPLEEIYAYEESFRVSFANLYHALNVRSPFEIRRWYRESSAMLNALDEIFLDANVAFALSRENLNNRSHPAYLEKSSDRKRHRLVVSYTYYGIPKAPVAIASTRPGKQPTNHGSQAYLKILIPSSRLRLGQRLGLATAEKNTKGQRRVPLNAADRSAFASQIKALHDQISTRYAWLTAAQKLTYDFEVSHPEPTSADILEWYAQMHKILSEH